MISNKQIRIVIIDNNVTFGTLIKEMLLEYKFEVSHISEEKKALDFLENNKYTIDLVLLNIDFDDQISTNIFEIISTKTDAKVILLSSEDVGKTREEFFSKGIIDYHLTNKKLDHTVDDIVESLGLLETNKKETILVIDKSEKLCNQIAFMLRSRNYKVITALNAKSGLEILRDEEISLLVLDMELEDILSLDLLEGLRDMYLLNDFFVMGIGTNEHPSIVRDVLKSGAKDFLKKPFLYEEFLLKIDILIKSVRTKKTIINQNKQIENNLKRFKELLDASIGAMFIFEKNICIECNNEAVSLLGYKSKADIKTKEIFDIFVDISDEHKHDILDNKIDYYCEDTIISKNGSKYDVQFKERNIHLDNKVLKIIAVLDVTDVKKQEKILSQQSKMASMGEMIGNIAHQWRQPLTAISIAAGGIKLNYEFDMEDRDETIYELDNIVENTKFLSSTIESFQNFLKADKITTKFDLKSTVKKTLAIINANLNSNNITIVQNYTGTYYLKGIENEVVQVFLNIINNAADVLKTLNYLKDEKYIIISVDANEESVIISIQDNANGIPEEILNKIFEPYFTTKHQSQGTGLGLYMTHQIITQMQGSIKIENRTFLYNEKEYTGANFIINFPLLS